MLLVWVQASIWERGIVKDQAEVWSFAIVWDQAWMSGYTKD